MRDRLSVVVRLRSIRERQQRVRLAVAEQKSKQASQNRDQRQRELQAMRPAPTELRPNTLRSLHMRGIQSYEMFEQAAAEEQIATQRYEEARRTWQRSLSEFDASKELQRRRTETIAYRARISADKALDQLMAARHREGNQK